MARTIWRLTALKVLRAQQPGMYADGGGLYLQVTSGGASWIYRFMLNRKAREMGLGPLTVYGLQEARAKALEARRLRHEGIDPIEARYTMRKRAELESAKAISFKECAEAYIKSHRAGWRNEKHAGQWQATLTTYAEPIIGALSVQSIDTALVMKVLELIWTTKPETASRLRGRIEAVIDWAKARGYREGENPARWRGHLDKLLPKPSKVRAKRHHPALPYGEIAAFMAELRSRDGTRWRALEFLVLTAARSQEVTGVRWRELDLAAKMWTVPAARMKGRREHRVPLADRAIEILAGLAQTGEFVFPMERAGCALLDLAKQIRPGLTVHGFRSSFRDWAAEMTAYPNHVVEMALAHAIGDRVEASYRRGDLFEKRRRLMNDWAKYCDRPAVAVRGVVTALHGAKASDVAR
jgi:integrase